MSLRWTTYSRGREFNTLTACPLCGYDFAPDESRPDHLAEEHGPADAGLAPLGETNEAAQKSLWGDEELDFIPEPEGWSA